ncbi:glucose-6-phosphate 1-dehydrogenase [Cardiosporidium cionae]|uniref:Glucose-6-phosphate 1-dehydrogenase n=1 Tax=Cardiosporidium cionae TaxID=476202 RepID=A0ABQ7JAX7_9APIC|nr:glucose-6-phosphate 1-dehydrogenase [Cardiosporidium cionae]|eukprot:KAF8820810.1 glucose-6-phosphate 1-dehydrogenase [Cardiosporidium cionae]
MEIQSESVLTRDGPIGFVRAMSNFEVPVVPRTLNCYAEDGFITEAANFLISHLLEKLQKPYVKVILGLSGGSTPIPIFEMINNLYKQSNGKLLDWTRILIFLVDERYVHPSHQDSNQHMIRETLLKNISIPEENIIFPNTHLPLMECIKDYENRLLNIFPLGNRPDIITLGLGDDGHVASWFPPLSNSEYEKAMHPLQLVFSTETEQFAVKQRITVSLSLICSADYKVFLLKGQRKINIWKNFEKQTDFLNFPALEIYHSPNTTAISFPPIYNDLISEFQAECIKSFLSIIIFGATGNLAITKTYPAIFGLFCEGLLPQNFQIVGYGRSIISTEELLDKIKLHILKAESYYTNRLPCGNILADDNLFEKFRMHCSYVSGNYNCIADFSRLNDHLIKIVDPKSWTSVCENRLFYLALPPTLFYEVVSSMKNVCRSNTGWNRVIIEKPFGRDLVSSNQLSKNLATVLSENEIYRIDHYLGKEMVLNLMILRFGNLAFLPLFHREYVNCIRITMKETIGTTGRAGYFDNFGILRDVVQNHLLQLLSLVAMERPASLKDDDVRDEKVKILKQIKSIGLNDIVIGQYTASEDGTQPGYLDDPMVPKDSLCPTFCSLVLWVNSERWQNVPFIIKAGKALEKRTTEIRLQLKEIPGSIFLSAVPNELVILVQPDEAIYLKMVTKKPGLTFEMEETELDLSVKDRFSIERMNDAYERLILDVIRGDKQHFVRTDELQEAWRIFSPLLQELDEKEVKPIPYPHGSKGPRESYDLINTYYKRYVHSNYTWKAKTS